MTPLIKTRKQQPPSRNFGLLKTRSLNIKPAEDNVFGRIYTSNRTSTYSSKTSDEIQELLDSGNLKTLRSLSRYFFQTNGIYSRSLRYLADLYRFDFIIYPNLDLSEEINADQSKKILKNYNTILEFFDNSDIQLQMRRWATQVIVEGAYYGYICDDCSDKLVIQDLPNEYCRSRFLYRGLPIVEFNAKYFQDITYDESTRQQILSLFPEEFQVAWRKYQAGKLQRETPSDEDGWFTLDVNKAFKFNFNDSDNPPFVYAIPALLSLNETTEIIQQILFQRMQKIFVQEFDLDSNGQLPLSILELQQLNTNAVNALGPTLGVTAFTTLGDSKILDVTTEQADTTTAIEEAEKTIYDILGVANNLFNTDSSTALEKSTNVDEGFIKPLLLQFEAFLNRFIANTFNKQNKGNGLKFRLKMLHTTIFNYQDLSGIYQNLTKIGYSRFLPAVCLGHTQKEVISMAKLESQILNLDTDMLPPFSSNTMSSDTWQQIKLMQGKNGNIDSASSSKKNNFQPINGDDSDDTNKGGRPELPDDEKSDKTLANLESKS